MQCCGGFNSLLASTVVIVCLFWWTGSVVGEQLQGRAVEALVRTKMQHKEFIILCLEDCSDWSNATTRRIVMQVQFSPFLPFYFTSSEVWFFLLSWKSTLRKLLGFFLFWGVFYRLTQNCQEQWLFPPSWTRGSLSLQAVLMLNSF